MLEDNKSARMKEIRKKRKTTMHNTEISP